MSFRSNKERTLHFELPNTENMSLTKGYARLFFTILTFRCLKSVTTLLSLANFLLINITGLEYTGESFFQYPHMAHLFHLFINECLIFLLNMIWSYKEWWFVCNINIYFNVWACTYFISQAKCFFLSVQHTHNFPLFFFN